MICKKPCVQCNVDDLWSRVANRIDSRDPLYPEEIESLLQMVNWVLEHGNVEHPHADSREDKR